MADVTVFPIPQIPNGYNKLGKKLMIHDLTEPEATSTKLINFENLLTTSVTYAELVNLITNNLLIEGGFYLLTDFVTVYDQPDYDINGTPKPIVVTKTSPNVEEIWVLALSSNQIADRAYSKTYPKDQIKYDWTYNATEINGSPAMGRISERIDDRGNRTDYDHREILFKRYDDGSGSYNSVNDNGNAFQEFLTFSNQSSNNYIGDFTKFRTFIGINFYLSNNVFFNVVVANIFGALNYNNTFNISVSSATTIGTGNSFILFKGTGALIKSFIGNQNKNITITDGDFNIGNNNQNIILNSNNSTFNVHKIGNQCTNITVGNLGCIQIGDNSSDITIADNGILFAFRGINVTILNNGGIFSTYTFLNNVTVGSDSSIFGTGEWTNIVIGNNNEENRFEGYISNVTATDGNSCFLKNVNTIVLNNTINSIIDDCENITFGTDNSNIKILNSSSILIGNTNTSLIFENITTNSPNIYTIGNSNNNCTFKGEFIKFEDGLINDLNNMQMCNFNFMDDTGWANGINPTNTPEVYTNDSEKTIFKGNGNFYEKHFNGTNDVFTLLS